MTNWQAFILGLIQGITEFLPISSSGHLALAHYLFDIKQDSTYFLFSIICHLGTLCAIFCMFFALIKESFYQNSTKLYTLALATLPLGILPLLLPVLKPYFNSIHVLGPGFLLSSICLFVAVYCPTIWNFLSKKQSSFLIGVCQTIAIFPGVSRSGITISAARLAGWSFSEAIHFSFLLAIPTIIGATVVETWQVWNSSATFLQTITDIGPFLIAFITSFIVGYFSLLFLIRVVIKEKWHYFAWYCLLLGSLLTFYFTI